MSVAPWMQTSQFKLWKVVLIAGLTGAVLSFVGELVKPKRVDAAPR